jgi:hypothetical protein
VGCGKKEPKDTSIKVSIAESLDYTIEKNGFRVNPGDDVTFVITLKDGYKLTGNDYRGESRIWQDDGKALLTLEKVKYPEQVHLTLANTFFSITYYSNDEMEIEHTVYEEKKYHLRPNTLPSQSAFKKDGYILTAWNTKEDGSGQRVGLGSRVSTEDKDLKLYAMWEKCENEEAFTTEMRDDGLYITGYAGSAEKLVIPDKIGEKDVKGIASFAISNCRARELIIGPNIAVIEDNAFFDGDFEIVTIFDNIEFVSDKTFNSCKKLKTLYINAAKKPAGAAVKKESCYADKVDLLIENADKKKLVFYGGCSVWYNLDMNRVFAEFGSKYFPVDMGLNGTVNSYVQLEILTNFLEDGDVLFNTPELASSYQMLEKIDMGKNDLKLWAGLEYNYDLFSLVDISKIKGVFDSFLWHISKRNNETEYADIYMDSKGRIYMGPNGEVPFGRFEAEAEKLMDEVRINSEVMSDEAYARLKETYEKIGKKGVKIFVSYACTNMDAISAAEAGLMNDVNEKYHGMIEDTGYAILISYIKDYCYYNSDFFDTNYHLLTPYAVNNTVKWMNDLKKYLKVD